MSSARQWPFVTRRCVRCTREAEVVVHVEGRAAPLGACVSHLEWAFFAGNAEWTDRNRRPTV